MAVTDVLEFIELAADAGASDLESLGPGASQKIAAELHALGIIDQATLTAIENNQYAGWLGLAFGFLAVAALATPIGATSEAIGVGATALVSSAADYLLTGAGYEIVGAYLGAEITSATGVMISVANAVISYYVSKGATALLSLADSAGAACADLVNKLFALGPQLYNGTATVSNVTVPSDVALWNLQSGPIDYTIYTNFGDQTLKVGPQVQISQPQVLGPVTGILTDNSGSQITLIYGAAGGPSNVEINGGDIDPDTRTNRHSTYPNHA